jgi:hypothetical protein
MGLLAIVGTAAMGYHEKKSTTPTSTGYIQNNYGNDVRFFLRR